MKTHFITWQIFLMWHHWSRIIIFRLQWALGVNLKTVAWGIRGSQKSKNANGTARSEPDGTRWCTGGEVKGNDANGVGSQHPYTVRRNTVYTIAVRWCIPWLPVVDWTDTPTNLNGLVHFAERPNLLSASVPSRFERAIHHAHRMIQRELICELEHTKYVTLIPHGSTE